MLNRIISTVTAQGRFGINGTSINRTFDGRWVNTIVLIRPKRRASQTAAKRRQSGQHVGSEEDAAQRNRFHPKPDVEPVGHHALDNESATEGIQGKKSGQTSDDAFRLMQTESATLGCGRGFCLDGDLRLRGQAQEDDGKCKAESPVTQNHGTINVRSFQAGVSGRLTNRSSSQCSQGRRQRSDEVVPSENSRALPVGDELRQGGLFDGQERADFVAAGTDHADGGGDQ